MDKKNTPEVKLGQYEGPLSPVTSALSPTRPWTSSLSTRPGCTRVYHPTTEPARRGFRALLDFAGYMDGKEIPDSRMEKVMVVLGDGKLDARRRAGHLRPPCRRGVPLRLYLPAGLPSAGAVRQDRTVRDRAPLSLAEKVAPAPDEAFAKSPADSLDALKADLRAKSRRSTRKG